MNRRKFLEAFALIPAIPVLGGYVENPHRHATGNRRESVLDETKNWRKARVVCAMTGEELQNVIIADERNGFVQSYKLDSRGLPACEGDEMQTVVEYRPIRILR